MPVKQLAPLTQTALEALRDLGLTETQERLIEATIKHCFVPAARAELHVDRETLSYILGAMLLTYECERPRPRGVS